MLQKGNYDTTFGSLINTKNIEKALLKYIGVKNEDFSYEYFTDIEDVKIVFITGYNHEEKELPVWDHPLIFEDLNKNTVIATDVRKYVRPDIDKPCRLSDIVKDQAGLNFNIIRTLLNILEFANHQELFRSLNKHFVVAYSMWVADVINVIITLNPVEKLEVEMAAAFYINNLLIEEDDWNESKHTIIARLQTYKLSMNIPRNIIKLHENNLNMESYEIDGLFKLIKAVLPEDKGSVIDTNSFVNVVSNIWYGPGGSECVLMSIESVSTWIALLYTVLNDKTFKRSRISSMIDKNKTKIKDKDFIKIIENFIKENRTNA